MRTRRKVAIVLAIVVIAALGGLLVLEIVGWTERTEYTPIGGDYFTYAIEPHGLRFWYPTRLATHIARIHDGVVTEITDFAGSNSGSSLRAFNWAAYGGNLAYIKRTGEHRLQEALMVFCPKTGPHVLIEGCDDYRELVAAPDGITLVPYASDRINSDQTRRLKFTADYLKRSDFEK